MPYLQPTLPPLPETIPQALVRATRHFSASSIEILESRGRSAGRHTFAELAPRLELAARRLYTWGVRPGDRVVVCLPTMWDWFDAWFGALLLGALPVAAAPPGALGSADAAVAKVLAVCELLSARCIVCLDPFVREVERTQGGSRPSAPLVISDALLSLPPATGAVLATPRSEDIAFLQLTSGSTGMPRAVMISHHNVIHNAWASGDVIGRGLGAPTHAWTDATVSWLPLYHDMGLIGGVFMSMVCGQDLVLLPPRAFLGRPHLWLEALARRQQTVSLAPNFAYQLCAERIAPRSVAGLDLSRWRAMLTGSEMVRPETMAAFFTAFESLGVSPDNARPGYGMAEATLTVSVATAGDGLRTHPLPAGASPVEGQHEVVGLGRPILDTAVRITAPDGGALPAERVGEIQVRGPGVFAGYWNDAEATRQALLPEGWLRTGDLGFIDQDGALYVSGRIKEILILRGHNLMPHEIEWLAEAEAGAGGSERCGAFSVTVTGRETEGEQAVVVIESDQDDLPARERLRQGVRSRIGRELGLPLADVVLVRRGEIPRTSSGKVKRSELRDWYLRGALERLP